MNVGVFTSGFFHVLFGILLIINIEKVLISKKEITQSINIQIISSKNYKKLISEEKILKSKPLGMDSSILLKPIAESEKVNNVGQEVIEAIGNELLGLTEPNIEKVKKRKTTDEIITGIAQDSNSGKSLTEEVKLADEKKTAEAKSKTELKIEKSEATTTSISSEGKEVEIVSGALKVAKLPLNKPSEVRKLKPTDLPEDDSNVNIYDQLVEEVAKVELTPEIKEIESPVQNLAKARMLQKLNSNWNVVSINRLPNYEKYLIILEIPLNSSGNIIGSIKTVYPKVVEGNFLIAKRSAINAVLESIPFQVPGEIFPKGLILRVVFDPKSNIGVNNG